MTMPAAGRNGCQSAAKSAATCAAGPLWSQSALHLVRCLDPAQHSAARWLRSTTRCGAAAARWCCVWAAGRSSCRLLLRSSVPAGCWRSRRWRQVPPQLRLFPCSSASFLCLHRACKRVPGTPAWRDECASVEAWEASSRDVAASHAPALPPPTPTPTSLPSSPTPSTAAWCEGVAGVAAALPPGATLRQWTAPLYAAQADDFRGGPRLAVGTCMPADAVPAPRWVPPPMLAMTASHFLGCSRAIGVVRRVTDGGVPLRAFPSASLPFRRAEKAEARGE